MFEDYVIEDDSIVEFICDREKELIKEIYEDTFNDDVDDFICNT